MILQLLLGGVAAIGVALKMYWNRVLRFLRIRKDDPTDEPAVNVHGADQPGVPAREQQKVEG